MVDIQPGSPETLDELHRRVPAARELDEPLTDGQVIGLLEHLLGAAELPGDEGA